MSEQPKATMVSNEVLDALYERIRELEAALHNAEAIGDFPEELRDRRALKEAASYVPKLLEEVERLKAQAKWPRCEQCNCELTDLGEGHGYVCKYCSRREEINKLREGLRRLEEVYGWAQAVLTALNVGDVKSGSPLHLKLREIMIAYRAALLEGKP